MAIRFDGKVAIVTGAGQGLGRAYATLLARRGAKVVINDLGKNKETGEYVADQVVAEIKAFGGIAVADYNSVVDGEKVVETAVKTFGTVHIIVNNAGIIRDKSFAKQTPQMWDLVMKVHLYGTRNVCHAAWPILKQQKYGRIVNITSINGLYGAIGQTNYSAAKSALLGFSKCLANEGKRYNIKCNVIAPGAGTAMSKTVMPGKLADKWKTEWVAPIVAYLCNDDPKLASGKIFEAGGGWFAEVKWTRSPGAFLDITKSYGPEEVRDAWSSITSFEGADYPDKTHGKGITKQMRQVLKMSSKL